MVGSHYGPFYGRSQKGAGPSIFSTFFDWISKNIPFGPQKLSHGLAWDPHSHGDPHSPCYLPKARTLIVIAGWPEQPGTLIVIGTLIVVYLLPITTGTLIVLTK